ncbi:hypothetical protein EDB71_1353 [Vibrio crassostreae]|nr:hypothetical protein EDB71_1353 [Vibrio crassostreae]
MLNSRCLLTYMKNDYAWLPYFTADFNHRFAKPAQYPKDMHRLVRESKQEFDENSRLTHETVKILDYPNGEIAIQYGHRKLEFKTFDKLEHVQQTQIVDNKRLGQVLKWD